MKLKGGGKGRDKVLVCVRIKPTRERGVTDMEAYELSVERNTLTLSEAHPNVMKRGGKSGREREYVYTFGECIKNSPLPKFHCHFLLNVYSC